MCLRKAASFAVLALVSCGGRSGLQDFEQAGNAGGAAAGSSGGAALGPWLTLHHEEPPAPSDNPFDWRGSPATFTDVWSDDPRRVRVAGVTHNYKAPSTGGVMGFEGAATFALSRSDNQPTLYQAPRLAGLSSSDFWLAEAYLGVEHTDGTVWTEYAEPIAQLIWENAPNDVWACSAACSAVNYLAHWDGQLWESFALPTLDGFIPGGLWSRSATDTFVAGSAGTVLHFDGRHFEVQKCAGVGEWTAVWGDAASIWTVGDSGAVARWNGGSCRLLPTEAVLGGVRRLTDIWGSRADNLWIVGQSGSILRWNGAGLELESSGTSEDLNAVWGHASGVVWAVGNGETLLRRTF